MAEKSRRSYDAFISYSHDDQEIVDRLKQWLTETAGLSIWRDKEAMPASSSISRTLDEGIDNSRTMLIVLSQNSLKSSWAAAERAQAIIESMDGSGLPTAEQFRLIPVRIDDNVQPRDVPGFLRDIKWIDSPGGELGLDSADQLLTALSHWQSGADPHGSRDVYVARSWDSAESSVADAVCHRLMDSGFRLIGDSTTQKAFDTDRIGSIIGSCGGFVAILPDRGEGKTSRYIPREIDIARQMQTPHLIVGEGDVELDDESLTAAIDRQMFKFSEPAIDTQMLDEAIESFCLHWREPTQPHFIFYATGFRKESHARRKTVTRLIERVTSLPCFMGDDYKNDKEIVERILEAQLVVADISAQNINSCIEAGIAMGAGKQLRLITNTPRREAPFMFRTLQQERYQTDAELLGIVHSLVYPYRRRVINSELASN